MDILGNQARSLRIDQLNAIKGDYLNTYLSVTAKHGTTIIPPTRPHHGKKKGGR